MRYYTIADTHGFFGETYLALKNAGYFSDKGKKRIVLCGDMMDRGGGTLDMQAFMEREFDKGRLIFIRGNHEDLMEQLIEEFPRYIDEIAWGYSHHIHNRTWKTALELTGMSDYDALRHPDAFRDTMRNTVFYSKLMPAAVDYFETNHYVFVHGWIPCMDTGYKYVPLKDFREASRVLWNKARWYNGMELAVEYNITVPDKQIVCGHWNTSWGHSKYEKHGSEWGKDADFSPFVRESIRALDACTAHSGRVYCTVLEEKRNQTPSLVTRIGVGALRP